MLKPTLILLLCVALFFGTMHTIVELYRDPDSWMLITYTVVAIIGYTIYAVRKLKREDAKKAAEESNIVTIDNEDCPENHTPWKRKSNK